MVKQIIKTQVFLDEHLPTNALGEKAGLTPFSEELTAEEAERLRQSATIYRNGLSDSDLKTQPGRIPLAPFLAPESLPTGALNVFLAPRGHLPRSYMFAGELSKSDLPNSLWIQQVKANAELGHEIRQEEGETRVYGAGRDSIGVGLRIYVGGSKRIVTKVTKGDVYNVIETY